MAPETVTGKRPIQRVLVDQMRRSKSGWVRKDMEHVFPSLMRRDDGATDVVIGSLTVVLECRPHRIASQRPDRW
jgi:hypothetical protein